ncbi:hypothetical protein F4801DRAFT_578708 [Xylaria longipes]|nr:hypothetical protein F4801DRAFT_578708 [Xylaria longipes]
MSCYWKESFAPSKPGPLDELKSIMESPSLESPAVLLEGGETLKSFTDHMRDQWMGEDVDGRKYVRTRRMIDWMRRSESNREIANGGLLLDDVYEAPQKPSSEFRPVEWMQLSNDNCIILFGLLIVLGYGHLIDEFRRHSIQDYLRQTGDIIEQHMLKDHFESSTSLRKFMNDFERRRWEFSPVEFDLAMDIILKDRRCVLPFCHKQRINHKGATAELYEVAVEEDFVQESLRVAIQSSRYNDPIFGLCYRFAFKSYSEDWQDIYKIEKNAFNGIGSEQDMIKCLGTVQCFDDRQTLHDLNTNPQQRSYNILLEYGEDDLNEYFFVHSPPTLGREILDFWEKLSQIADALRRVHNLEKKMNNGSSIRFEGCHADVKPDNILRVQGNFKLADFGFATFVPRDGDVGSISPVGAPEFFQMGKKLSNDGNNFTVTNTIDTWSFACVISVAVTWVVLGLQGIKQFQTVRKAAIKKIKSNPEASTAHLLSDDTFHDGSVVLDDVTNWHEYLRQVMRKSDPISHQLLDLIDNEVLGQDPDNRLTSAALYKKLKDLLVVTKNELNEQIAESIIESMISFDRTAPSTMEEYQQRLEKSSLIQPEGGDSKHANKSARLTNIVPAKVAHRQILEAALGRNSFSNGDSQRGSTPNYGSSVYLADTTSTSRLQEHDPKALAPLRTSTIINTGDTPIYKEYSSLRSKNRFKVGPLLRPREDQYLSNFIKGRDIKFIVDNGTSMRKYLEHAKATLLVLAEKVVASDEDGVDLIFTFADNRLGRRNVKDPWGKFGRAMDSAGGRISTDPQKPLATDMARTLGEVFQEYEEKKTKQRMTLIILTDGVWEGSVQPNEVEEKIAKFFKDSKRTRTNGFEDRPFTIQFVSFGGQATDRLNALDDDMETKYSIPDAIDHEPWTGNPDKMILGSVVPGFDTTPTSASVNQQEMLTIQPQDSPGLRRRLSSLSSYGKPR